MAFVPKCGRHALKLMSTCRSHSLQHTIRKGTFVLDSYSLTFREFSSLFHLNSGFMKGNIHTKNRKSRLYDPTSTCSNDYATETTSIDDSGKLVTVSLGDGSQSKFHSIWLRNNCHCGDCKHGSSGMKRLDVAEINPDVKVKSIQNDGSGSFSISWTNDDHNGHVPVKFLKDNAYYENNVQTARLSENSEKRIIPEIKYLEVASGKAGVLKWLRHMNDYGLCLIKDVPNEHFIVVKIAEYIAPVVNNVSYGDRFEVLSIPDPSNVAYSTEGLYFHCDLPYYESPPGLQFLHCLRFDSCVEGGATTFLDAFHVAEKFRQEHPADFDALTRIPVTFKMIHYERDNPIHMTYQRPHIAVNHKKEIVGVYWAAAIEDALSVPAGDVETYYRAYHKFAAAIKYSPVIREHKLQPGDLIVFNNRRFLHGRNSFNLNGGVRHFQGCYINSDEYKSKLSVLSNQLGDNRPIFHCGNQSW